MDSKTRSLCIILSAIVLSPPKSPADELRMPLALELAENRETLVAGFKNGGLAAIDARRNRVRQFLELPGSITDLARQDDATLLATDFARGRLLRIQVSQGQLKIAEEAEVGPYPVSVSIDPWKKRAYVAAKWSKKLVCLEIGSRLLVDAAVELPFAPREQLLVKNGAKLLVADAHGGQLAVIDAVSARLESVRAIPAHNIRGLATNPEGDQIYLSHQRLNPLARTSFDDIHWGMAVSNVIRAIPLKALLDPEANLAKSSQIWNLGTVGHGAGDPDEMAVLDSGEIAVAVSGTGQIFFGEFGDSEIVRLEIGARPVALAADEFGERLFVANALDDLISVVGLSRRRLVATISLARQNLMISAADRGARLFFNARLSHDGWFSCHSCHTNGHTNDGIADTFGDGSFGTPKRIPSLLGKAKTAPFGWLGNHPTLRDQIRSSLQTTMHHRGRKLARDEAGDLAAFLASLPPLPRNAPTSAAARGKALFAKLECARCHGGHALTTTNTFDVETADEAGNVEFNPPSLRGLRHQRTFFHDARFESLPAVFEQGRHRLDKPLSTAELADLLAYLRSL